MTTPTLAERLAEVLPCEVSKACDGRDFLCAPCQARPAVLALFEEVIAEALERAAKSDTARFIRARKGETT